MSKLHRRSATKIALNAISAMAGLMIALAPLSVSYADTSSSGASNARSDPAQEAQTPTTVLKPILVTGSLIQTTARVGYNQVQVVSLKEIRASGAVTVSEYLRNIAVNSANSWGDNFA